jgi:hypothetical protein
MPAVSNVAEHTAEWLIPECSTAAVGSQPEPIKMSDAKHVLLLACRATVTAGACAVQGAGEQAR